MSENRCLAPQLFLASKSPRRRELLAQIGVAFDVIQVDVAEVLQDGEQPREYVKRLAQNKAEAGVYSAPKEAVILGADTVVCLQNKVLEKPVDQAHGVNMLMQLSNNQHSVFTAVALANADRSEVVVCESKVRFRHISEQEALAYWHTGEPRDKAGGYGIQGMGAVFVQQLSGSYSNVVGLPLFETSTLLAQFSIPIWQNMDSPTDLGLENSLDE